MANYDEFHTVSLKITGMPTSFTCITKSGQRHGGAFGAQMYLFSRLVRIIKVPMHDSFPLSSYQFFICLIVE